MAEPDMPHDLAVFLLVGALVGAVVGLVLYWILASLIDSRSRQAQHRSWGRLFGTLALKTFTWIVLVPGLALASFLGTGAFIESAMSTGG